MVSFFLLPKKLRMTRKQFRTGRNLREASSSIASIQNFPTFQCCRKLWGVDWRLQQVKSNRLSMQKAHGPAVPSLLEIGNMVITKARIIETALGARYTHSPDYSISKSKINSIHLITHDYQDKLIK